ncbi:hypothetical protein SNARM312S_01440 [Streptomyces narbonensis]
MAYPKPAGFLRARSTRPGIAELSRTARIVSPMEPLPSAAKKAESVSLSRLA